MASSKKKTKTVAKAKVKTKAKAKPVARTPPSRKESSTGADKGLTLTAVSPSFTVDNVEKSLAWYRDVMGFAVGKRWEEKGTLLGVELKAGNTIFMIGQDDWGKGKHRIKGAGFRLYCDTTQDVDRIAAGIKARGGSLVEEPRDEKEWNSRYFTVQDPDGFKITISMDL